MNFTDIFIKRPVLATVLSFIIILVGVTSASTLPVRLYPKVDASVVTVTVTYAGADAELMEGFVTTPIENAIAGVDGVDYMISQSMPGNASITIYFTLGYDINAAVSDVNSKVSSVRYELPSDIDDPVVSKNDPNATPSMYINFYSDSMDTLQITDYLSRVVQPQMQTLPGVSQAQIYGSEYAMRVWLDPTLMAAHSITTTDIRNALTYNNLQSPSGPIKSALQELNVKTVTDVNTAQEFDNLVLKDTGNGSMIRVRDVGHTELGAKTSDISVYMGKKKTVVVAITPGPTANPVDVSKEIKDLLPKLANTMPKGLNSSIVWDNAIYIQQSIEEVKKTIIEATICVIIIVFLFLGAWRVLLIPVVTIPLSLIGVCGIMLAMGYTINTITLLAMVLAIGMVVDDAIVVAENIHRHLAEGKSPVEASLIGAREIQFAIISMTFTLAAVYAPIGFMGGVTGSLFKEFAFTLSAAVVISGFVALTLSPMMCSKIMTKDSLNGFLAIKIHHFLEIVMHFYRRVLTKILSFRKAALAIVATISIIIVLLGVALLLIITPKDLAPKEDIGGIYLIMTGPTSANFAYTEKYTKFVTPIVESYPENATSLIVNGPDTPNAAIGFMVLKPWNERKRSAFPIAKELMGKFMKITGITAYAVVPSMLPGASGSMPIEVVLQTVGDYSELYKAMQALEAKARANPGLMAVDTDLRLDQPQINVNINRSRAGDLGIKAGDIGDAVNIALGEPTINRFSIMGRAYDVIPELLPEYRNQPDTLNLLYLRTASNDLVPLSNLVSLQETLQPQSLNHFQQLRSATLTATPVPGYTLGQALSYLQKAAKEVVPKNMSIDYGGDSRQYIQEGNALFGTLIFALIFIFLILAAQFESFLDPLIVLLFSVPFTFFGALLILKLSHNTLNIYSEIGLVTLVGLISKHGILMVEFANQLQEGGRSIKEAIIESATIRLRPILMTTGAMVLGAFPLAFATGAGAISRGQIGLVIIGGMSIGTVFTLFVVPAAYSLLAHKRSGSETAQLPPRVDDEKASGTNKQTIGQEVKTSESDGSARHKKSNFFSSTLLNVLDVILDFFSGPHR